MKCTLCGNDIEAQENGWDQGHNAWPLGPGNQDGEDRCCGTCNMTKVLPERLKMVRENVSPTYIGDISELNKKE